MEYSNNYEKKGRGAECEVKDDMTRTALTKLSIVEIVMFLVLVNQIF